MSYCRCVSESHNNTCNLHYNESTNNGPNLSHMFWSISHRVWHTQCFRVWCGYFYRMMHIRSFIILFYFSFLSPNAHNSFILPLFSVVSIIISRTENSIQFHSLSFRRITLSRSLMRLHLIKILLIEFLFERIKRMETIPI